MRSVLTPPANSPTTAGLIDGGWWHDAEEDGRIICDLCPRECSLKAGDRGFCFVRQNVEGDMKLTTYGRSTGFCIDPIEKKPLNHFLPGTPVLSFGTAGCNLGCKFCQNWDISKSREVERLSDLALPDMIAEAAQKTGCRSVAYTYNDPIIWAEYAIDTAAACRDRGIKSVAVTAGYISPEARPAFFHAMDAANVDLKAFTEDFYHRITYSHLQPVLDTLRWLKHESDVWFEITNLLIPDANDSPDEIRRTCDWIMDAVGPDVPVHFTAFHPDFRMQDRGRTPHETLLKARQMALEQGVRFVYVGNVHDVQHQSTWCPECHTLLIERDWHQLGTWNMKSGGCANCGASVPGVFEETPGTWGRRRQPIRISDHSAVPENLVQLSAPETSAMPSSVRKVKPNMDAVKERPALTEEQESAVHDAACEIVTATVRKQPVRLSDATLKGAAESTVMGTFVTLKRDGQLRGCCGALGQPMKLLPALTQSAVRTAAEDHRFPPVSPTELPHLTLDVTLLFNFEPVTTTGEARVHAVEIGKHGLKIVHGKRSGLLLPVVAVEHNWDARTFLDQVCRKAGLPVTAWQQPDSRLIRFEGRMIERAIDPAILSAAGSSGVHPVSQQELDALTTFARSNIIALYQGAVPSCFPANCSDGTVDGLALRMSFPGTEDHVTLSQMQFRGGYPLQTTLLKITEQAAGWLRQARIEFSHINRMKVDLILFADPAMHGTLESPDLSGLDPAARTLVVGHGQRSSWHFEKDMTAEQLVDAVRHSARVINPAAARLFSFATVSSVTPFSHSSAPQAQPGPDVRQPGVAGKFYPSSEPALRAVVRNCLGDIPETKEQWPAVMVPHAGLQYSGRIAGDVLKRVVIPETVIIIGPKHTRDGVDWAVAPHNTWRLPGQSLASDTDLAGKLAAEIEGLELDAGAHAREHCIEVELPLLAQLSPQTRVVGIAIGGGSLQQCRRFGRQLSAILSAMPSAPLLVISSDMNHFASDEENRRLDELALQAMESLDPATLFDVVRSNNISMCGVLPAVVVMEALRQSNQLSATQRTGYATSAEVSGDSSRVVGYAGMLLG